MKVTMSIKREEIAQSVTDMKQLYAELVKANVITVDEMLMAEQAMDEMAQFASEEHSQETVVNKHLQVNARSYRDGHMEVCYEISKEALHAMNMVTAKMAGRVAKVVLGIKSVIEAIVDFKSLKAEFDSTVKEFFGIKAEETAEADEDDISSEEKVYMNVG
jgi:hypothetical protein